MLRKATLLAIPPQCEPTSRHFLRVLLAIHRWQHPSRTYFFKLDHFPNYSGLSDACSFPKQLGSKNDASNKLSFAKQFPEPEYYLHATSNRATSDAAANDAAATDAAAANDATATAISSEPNDVATIPWNTAEFQQWAKPILKQRNGNGNANAMIKFII